MVLSSIWKNLPHELVHIIMTQYIFHYDDLDKACFYNDIKTINYIFKIYNLNINDCLLVGSINGYIHLVKYTIEKKATQKLQALYYANLYGNFEIKQFLKKLVD